MQSTDNSIEFGRELKVTKTDIPGLLVIDLPVHGDSRGWFKENWQREKMLALGLPDFGPVQNNISFNTEKGVTRGVHAEPWDKFISVATGKVFGAWVDLREGESFGKVFSIEITPDRAIFVPRGVANSYQSLEANTAYSYLVNAHWRPGVKYDALNIADESLGIKWPIALSEAIISDKDKENPFLKDAQPISKLNIFITGGNGQLGLALREQYPDAKWGDSAELDITDLDALRSFDWGPTSVIINAAAYTNVDGAETEEGRRVAWKVNAEGVANLATICNERGMTLVHVSSDYVFDGKKTNHSEMEHFSPISAYGASKAAGDLAATSMPRHYILRTSWVIGEGKNFVRTMIGLGEKGVSPSVVSDQLGRLTFTSELVRAIDFLLVKDSPYGTYNLTNDGDVVSWADITEEIFNECNYKLNVVKITTEEYFKGKTGIAPRPENSDLNLDKLRNLGFKFTNWRVDLSKYINKELEK